MYGAKDGNETMYRERNAINNRVAINRDGLRAIMMRCSPGKFIRIVTRQDYLRPHLRQIIFT